MCAGIALIKPTSFLLLATRTPQCHSDFQPGGLRALKDHLLHNLNLNLNMDQQILSVFYQYVTNSTVFFGLFVSIITCFMGQVKSL